MGQPKVVLLVLTNPVFETGKHVPPPAVGYQGIRVSLRVPLDLHSFALSLTPLNQCRGAPDGGRCMSCMTSALLCRKFWIVAYSHSRGRSSKASSVEPAVVVPWWGNCCCRRRCEACATVVAGV